MFKGSICALITPFRDGEVDEAALERLVDWHVDQGTHGLVPCGTTGESPTLSHDEHERVIELVVKKAAGRVPVIAGAGSNSTREARRLHKHAKDAGADAALSVTPYYNKPNQEGLYQHFKALNDHVDLPIFVYNIPGRSVINVNVETMARIAALPNIVGVKDATADLTLPALYRQEIGPEFIQLSGEDGTALPYMAAGGHGCISVTANIAPKLCADFQNACMAEDFAAAREINAQLMPLHTALFLEPNPTPVKFAAAELDLITEQLRLPLVPVAKRTQEAVRSAMRHAGLL